MERPWKSPLDLALNGHTVALKRLIEAGCDVNQAEKKSGMTPAHCAAQQGHTAALEVLIEAGCDVNQRANNGMTPAHVAAGEGHTVALETLVKAPGCDVNQATNDGRAPAHIAAWKGHTAELDVLIKAGCNVNQVEVNGWTPAYLAAHEGQTAALELLLKAGCLVDRKLRSLLELKFPERKIRALLKENIEAKLAAARTHKNTEDDATKTAPFDEKDDAGNSKEQETPPVGYKKKTRRGGKKKKHDKKQEEEEEEGASAEEETMTAAPRAEMGAEGTDDENEDRSEPLAQVDPQYPPTTTDQTPQTTADLGGGIIMPVVVDIYAALLSESDEELEICRCTTCLELERELEEQE